jgi:hypothetical protein
MTLIISMLFLVFTTVLTIYIGTLETFITAAVPAVKCPNYFGPEDPNDFEYKKMAYEDFFLPEEKREGLMDCYCSKFSQLYLPWTLFSRVFTDVQLDLGEVPKKRFFCLERRLLWLTKTITLAVVATSAVLINGLISNIFKSLGEYTKKHTKVEE